MKLTGLKKLVEASGSGGFTGSGGYTKPEPETETDSWTDYAKMAGAALATPARQLAGGAFGVGSITGFGKQSAMDWAQNTRNLLSGAAGLAGTALTSVGDKIGGPLPPAPGNAAGRAVSTIGKIASTVAPTVAKYGNAFLDTASVVGSVAAGDFRNAIHLGGFKTEKPKQNIQKVKIVG